MSKIENHFSRDSFCVERLENQDNFSFLLFFFCFFTEVLSGDCVIVDSDHLVLFCWLFLLVLRVINPIHE